MTPVSIEDIIQRVAAEAARRASPPPVAVVPGSTTSPALTPVPEFVRLGVGAGSLEVRDRYVLDDLLAIHGEEFVRNAYRALLRREPDAGGLNGFLGDLAAGRRSKTEVLGAIRYSAEGRLAGVPVQGLPVAYAARLVRRIPVLGRLLGIVQYIVRLPRVVQNLERLEAGAMQRDVEVRVAMNQLGTQVHGVLARQQGEFATALGQKADDQRLTEWAIELAPKAALATLQQRVEVDAAALQALRDTTLAELQASLIRKVDTERLTELGEALSRKADAERLTELGEALSRKADAERLAEMATQLGGLIESNPRLDGLAQTVTGALQDLARLRSSIDALVASKADRDVLEAAVADIEQRKVQAGLIDGAVTELRARLLDYRLMVLDQERRVALLLEEARKRLPAPLDQSQLTAMVAQERQLLDAFYVNFEDRFRGTREDIKERVAVYLPTVRDCAPSTAAPILDLGCGRGEWLELLREHGLAARGIDLNEAMIDRCVAIGLDVVHADAIEYLRELPPNSIAAVTAMHIIEHIPFRQIVSLLDETLRVLRPGGVMVFETPNPENVIVGSCNFWYDPTHLQPLPPEMMSFLAEARGFARVAILRLHPFPDEVRLNDGDESMRDRLNTLFYGPQDYSLCAWKA